MKSIMTNPTYTFRNGVVATIVGVSPLLTNRISRTFKPPKPPMQDVQYENKTVQEPNPDDPGYRAQMAEWRQERALRIQSLMLNTGLELAVDVEAVSKFRAWFTETYGEVLTESDKEVYVAYICMSGEQELSHLVSLIRGAKQATEDEVVNALAGFRPGDES